jgi:hypothetical protein
MPRFAVLQHDSPRGLHWDFLLETGPTLSTWELAQAPDTAGPIAARPLPDHRLVYLEYEGPISGDRGHVRQWDQGTFQMQRDTEAELVVDLAGRKLAGRARLVRLSKETDEWLFRFVSAH